MEQHCLAPGSVCGGRGGVEAGERVRQGDLIGCFDDFLSPLPTRRKRPLPSVSAGSWGAEVTLLHSVMGDIPAEESCQLGSPPPHKSPGWK